MTESPLRSGPEPRLYGLSSASTPRLSDDGPESNSSIALRVLSDMGTAGTLSPDPSAAGTFAGSCLGGNNPSASSTGGLAFCAAAGPTTNANDEDCDTCEALHCCLLGWENHGY
jgi:hypothetical protein